MVRLNHLGVSISGKTPKSDELSDDGKYPYFKVGDMNTSGNEVFMQFTEKYLSEDYSGKLFAPNSIVFPKNGGAVFTNKKRILKYESVVDLNTGVFTPYSCLDLKFMYWMFNSIDFNKYYKGTALPTVDKKRMDNLFFGIPPLNEQKRIVKKIEELFPFIEKYDNLETSLNQLNDEFPSKIKDSILQEAIQGKLVPQDPNDEPASILLERIKDEKDRLVKEKIIKKNKSESFIFKENNHFYEKVGKNEPVCIDDEIPFEIPNNWQWCRMENIIQLISGRDMKSNEYNDEEQGIPYITGASNIENNDLIINRWIENPGVISIKNDILLTCKGTIGKLFVLNEPKVHIARQIMAIRIFDENLVIRDYILLILEYYVKKLQIIAKSMIPGISRGDVLKILVPLPPLNEQKDIVIKNEELLNIFKKFIH